MNNSSNELTDHPHRVFYLVTAFLLGVSTILMVQLTNHFDVGYNLTHPQFITIDNFHWDYYKIMSSSSSKYYNRFFATDFLWAASFLICLHGLIIYTTKLRLTGTTIKYNWGYLTFAILAYLTDVIENTIYLGVEFTYPIAHLLPCLIQIKKVLYGLVIIFTIIKVTKRYEVS